MRIGIDIDNTICKTLYISNLIYKNKYNCDMYNLDKFDMYHFTAMYEKEIFDNCPLESNVKEVINELSKENEIYFITARSNSYIADIKKRTINYLKKNKIPYDDIFFGHDDKLEIYKKLNLDIMIDDDYFVYEKLTKNGYKALLYDGVLNKNKEGKKVKNWLEIKKIIERMQ